MNAITVRNLSYEVPQKRILTDINLEIAAGEIVSIMGMSGSGKTTLLKLLTGLIKPTSGQILVGDVDIAQLSESELDEVRLKMGLVFQYAALFDSLTIYDNIVFGVVRHRKRVKRKDLDELVRKLLAQVQLEGVEKRLPSELSGGMQKRVGLARALAMEPSLVFYDEPTSGLDPVTANAIDELIMDTRERMQVTSVVVSHHLPSIFRISDRVAMLHQGEIVIHDTPEKVQASPDPIVQNFIHPERKQEQG
ncbi:MAG TPA: ATP-binding cassette domain-containing protein [Chthonomonadaceae bacterium]|nr:ATP-binding cassette domain-containing protein [Chthonomonadaceae bacterium]